MNLSGRSYLIAGIVTLLGVLSEWSDRAGADLWRIPMAAFLLALVLEGLGSRRAAPMLERRLPSRGYLGQPLQGEMVLANPGRQALRLESLDDFPDGLDAPREPVRAIWPDP